ncbi:MAG TPA: GIY-YIG nuclease family protein [Burkholderiales bacterium]
MKNRLSELSGSEKASATRIINTLEKRIEKYRHGSRPVGEWAFSVAFYIYTEGVAQVESLSHEILAEHLDRLAPFGEVFCCSASEATEAVETALSQLGLLNSARKRTPTEFQRR